MYWVLNCNTEKHNKCSSVQLLSFHTNLILYNWWYTCSIGMLVLVDLHLLILWVTPHPPPPHTHTRNNVLYTTCTIMRIEYIHQAEHAHNMYNKWKRYNNYVHTNYIYTTHTHTHTTYTLHAQIMPYMYIYI